MKSHPPYPTQHRALTSGFTLIEIVIVLTIISILGAGVMFMTKGWIDTSKDSRVTTDLNNFKVALLGYESRNMRLPTMDQGLKALAERPTVEPLPERWVQLLEEVSKDPWDQDYKYRIPAQKSNKGYDLWSVGPDGQDGTDDDIGNWKATPTK